MKVRFKRLHPDAVVCLFKFIQPTAEQAEPPGVKEIECSISLLNLGVIYNHV